MMDYSLTLNQKKDFILGYDVTKEGSIIVKFAEGEPITLPYNEKNEKILLDKMEKQVIIASSSEKKYKKKRERYVKLLKTMLGSSLISIIIVLSSEIVFVDALFAYILAFSGIYGIVFTANIVNIDRMLEDLEKNKKFLEIKDKINNNINTNQNTLVNVSGYTKKFVKENIDDARPLFDINSFNYVEYKDLEQISENIDRNESFGFDYTKRETPSKGIVRKKTRY